MNDAEREALIEASSPTTRPKLHDLRPPDDAPDFFDMFRNPNVSDGRKKYEAEMRLRWPPGRPPATALSFGIGIPRGIGDTTMSRIKLAVEATRDKQGPPPEAILTPAMAREHVAGCESCQAYED